MTTTFAEIAKSRHVLLTTFTKDGRPKPTAIWVAPEGDRLLVFTDSESWKVKRIRNTPRVTIAACTMRGNPKSEPVDAVANILDRSETANTRQAILKRYGLIGRLLNVLINLSRGSDQNVALELKPANVGG